MLDITPEPAGDLSSPATTEPVPINDQALLDAYSRAVIGVTERIGPAVVRVETGPKTPGSRERGGLGSGIVISPDGLVLTNSHVVGSSKQIRLRDHEGIVTDARVLGVDPDTDLALLRADGVRDLHYASLGNSKKPAPWPARGRDRQPAGFQIDRHGRRGVGARPFDPFRERPDHRRRHPDRCGAQSRQFRRPAGVVGIRGDRHQHRDHQRRAGHLLCGRQQHRAVRAVRDHPPRLCAARLYRRIRPECADSKTACGDRRRREQDGRVAGADSSRTGRQRRPGCCRATSSFVSMASTSTGSTI